MATAYTRRVPFNIVPKGPFMATQRNSTDLLRADWLYAATGSVALPIVGDS